MQQYSYAQHWLDINYSRRSNSYDFRTAVEILVFRNLLLQLSNPVEQNKPHRGDRPGLNSGGVPSSTAPFADILLHPSAFQVLSVHIYECVERLNLWPAIPWSTPYLWNREFAWFVLWVIWHLVLTSIPYYIRKLHMHCCTCMHGSSKQLSV